MGSTTNLPQRISSHLRHKNADGYALIDAHVTRAISAARRAEDQALAWMRRHYRTIYGTREEFADAKFHAAVACAEVYADVCARACAHHDDEDD